MPNGMYLLAKHMLLYLLLLTLALPQLGAVVPETVSVAILVTATSEQAHTSTCLVLCVSPCVSKTVMCVPYRHT
jgi:hypothetical protein